MTAGQRGAAPITHFEASLFKTQFACEVKNFTVNDFIDRKEARKMYLFTQYAMVSSDEALADAGILDADPNLDRIGVIWGSGIGGLDTFLKECGDFATGSGVPRFNTFCIPKMIADIAPGLISIKYGFRGPYFATVSACASASNAMIDVLNYIRLG